MTSLAVVPNRWSPWWVIGGYVVASVSAAVAVTLWVGAFGDAGIAAVLIGSVGLWVGFVGAPSTSPVNSPASNNPPDTIEGAPPEKA